jgi:Uma2 family endonuclease
MSTKTLITAEELLKMGEMKRWELVKGELIQMAPAGYGHGRISLKIGRLLGNFAEERNLGVVCAAETGVITSRNPDTVRAPDAMFISNERLSDDIDPEHFLSIPPDLAVEVIFPSERWSEIEEKVEEYIKTGVRLIWLIDPRTRTVHVHRPPNEVRILKEDDTLTGEDVLPEFSVSIKALLAI